MTIFMFCKFVIIYLQVLPFVTIVRKLNAKMEERI